MTWFLPSLRRGTGCSQRSFGFARARSIVQAAVVRHNCSGETVQTKARAQLDLQTRAELLPPRSPVAVPGRAPVVGSCVSPSVRQCPMG